VRQRVVSAPVDTAHPFFTSRELSFRERPNFLGLLRRPDVHLRDLIEERVLDVEELSREDIVAIETDIKYEGYLRQQAREVEKLRKAEAKRIPDDLDYAD